MIKIKKISKFGIYEFTFKNHKFEIIKSDDGEWHLSLFVNTQFEDKHFLNNYKTIKQIKWEFEKDLKTIQHYMNEVEERLIKYDGQKKGFYNFNLLN